jgi:hypothetical protein
MGASTGEIGRGEEGRYRGVAREENIARYQHQTVTMIEERKQTRRTDWLRNLRSLDDILNLGRLVLIQEDGRSTVLRLAQLPSDLVRQPKRSVWLSVETSKDLVHAERAFARELSRHSRRRDARRGNDGRTFRCRRLSLERRSEDELLVLAGSGSGSGLVVFLGWTGERDGVATGRGRGRKLVRGVSIGGVDERSSGGFLALAEEDLVEIRDRSRASHRAFVRRRGLSRRGLNGGVLVPLARRRSLLPFVREDAATRRSRGEIGEGSVKVHRLGDGRRDRADVRLSRGSLGGGSIVGSRRGTGASGLAGDSRTCRLLLARSGLRRAVADGSRALMVGRAVRVLLRRGGKGRVGAVGVSGEVGNREIVLGRVGGVDLVGNVLHYEQNCNGKEVSSNFGIASRG